MNFLQDKKYLYLGGGLALLFIFWMALGTESSDAPVIYTTAKKGTFEVTVTTSGELRAKNSTSIRGPEGIREFRIYNVPIQRLVPEGTVVEKGDFVAELDRSEISSNYQDQLLELEEEESAYEIAQLDSSLTLSEARDNLVNLEYALEEAEIAVEQSKYESPAVQRQVQIDYERAQRELQQARKNYRTRVQQEVATLREIEADLKQERREVQRIREIMERFTIYAPENGMVIYKRNRDGSKITEGSSISAWDPTVAELPDFSVMNSVTFVNEVDIQSIRSGQKVDIGLDAMPEKKLTGVVTSVANIGEQRPNSDSKVFQVIIEVNEPDTTLRPSMTTSNTIHVNTLDDALFAPLETIHTVDSLNYVFKRDGMDVIMQQVVLGMMNDNDVVIKEGVALNDQLYLSTPADTAGIARQHLPAEVLDQYKKQEELETPDNSAGEQQEISEDFPQRGNAGNPAGGQQ
ncbi:efflux RND transporter periplasmic adaptor subunit [Aliifodinibius sp. S!AR15-10]|uniref:efflux RND transporter periplasmic adaptor subunit n=1 Tax=Aliifodinibius sp. S!AR15-10 TaxID=2950437 RepID=UPI00285C1090|nr:efflux RND transporter periplasmic adaptor subunit [Aliifodinibius sp. S!AR15-10]MDR8391990.1 efflux RND transporter periplasmic adaptor subunit [Aliifodinibius sp. S!AR15-10]